MQGVIEVERDVADLDDLLHQSHDSQRPMQTVRSLYANFCAIANPPPARSPARFYGACRGAGESFPATCLQQFSSCSRRYEKARKTNVLRASNRGARGRLEAFSVCRVVAEYWQFGCQAMPLKMPLKRKVPLRFGVISRLLFGAAPGGNAAAKSSRSGARLELPQRAQMLPWRRRRLPASKLRSRSGAELPQ